MAIASLVLVIIWIWGLGSLLALIFGIVGKNQIDRSHGQQGGSGMALAGIVLGIVGLAVTAAILIAILAASGSSESAGLVISPAVKSRAKERG
jgi:Na+/proline symporter